MMKVEDDKTGTQQATFNPGSCERVNQTSDRTEMCSELKKKVDPEPRSFSLSVRNATTYYHPFYDRNDLSAVFYRIGS